MCDLWGKAAEGRGVPVARMAARLCCADIQWEQNDRGLSVRHISAWPAEAAVTSLSVATSPCVPLFTPKNKLEGAAKAWRRGRLARLSSPRLCVLPPLFTPVVAAFVVFASSLQEVGLKLLQTKPRIARVRVGINCSVWLSTRPGEGRCRVLFWTTDRS